MAELWGDKDDPPDEGLVLRTTIKLVATIAYFIAAICWYPVFKQDMQRINGGRWHQVDRAICIGACIIWPLPVIVWGTGELLKQEADW